MNPAFRVVIVVSQDVSSFYAGAEFLQSFLPIQMWGHNSDGPSEERKIHQLCWLVHYSLSSLHTCTTSRSSGRGCYMQVMAVEMMGIRNTYKILVRKFKEIYQFEDMDTDQRIILK